MGPLLGINEFQGKPYIVAADVDRKTHYPSEPLLDTLQWKLIVDYYLNTAPDTLVITPPSKPVIVGLPMFKVILPYDSSFYSTASIASFVKIDTTEAQHRIFVSNGINNKLTYINNKFEIVSSINSNGPIVDILFKHDKIFSCEIGKTMEANNLRNGTITPLLIGANKQLSFSPKPMITDLARPIKIIEADLNNDGKNDYIISQFGNIIGELIWMENLGNDKFKKHILRNIPGSMNIIVNDYNKDGLPDIWVQFAQAEEGIFLFTNKGNGKFDEREVLRFPPSYGSTYFELVDFNKDGYDDIIYVSGDNADDTPILKPYHGVYIYLNDGKNNFVQKYFYHVNGCYKAIAKDFDNDGKVDIATISFFPSNLQPEEAFLLHKNLGNYQFQCYSLPVGTPFQKGITMDAGDIDGDGRIDLILGSGYYSSKTNEQHKEPLYIILKNVGRIAK